MDIRKFFAPKGPSAGGAGAARVNKGEDKPASKGEDKPAAAAAPAANSAGSSKPPAAARTPSRGKGSSKSPQGAAAAAKPKAASGSPAAKAAAAPAVPAKRKKAAVSYKEDQEGGDKSDSWEQEASGSDDDFEINLVSEDEEEEAVGGSQKSAAKKDKKAKSAEPAAKRPKPITPASTRKKAAGQKLPAALQRIAEDTAAMAAVQAVDAAAAALPPFNDDAILFMSDNAYAGRAPDEPPNHGSKVAPVGHPDCLTGKTFVISGTLDSLMRGEAEDFIKRHGGKVTGNVSGKTSFLVVGSHAGRTKVFNAKEKEVRRISEDDLFALVRAAPAPAGYAEPVDLIEEDVEMVDVKLEQPAAAVAASPAKQRQQQQQPQAAGPSGSGMAPKSFYGGGAGAGAAGWKTVGPAAAPSAAAAAAAVAPAPPRRPPAADQQLWVEKWRPKSSQELVGNQITVTTLRQWLGDWERVHLHGGEPRAPPGRSSKQQQADMKKKAVLLSGPPGIGKTSSALIVCRELGFEPVEVNASDTRGKADASVLKGVGGKLANAVKELSTNTAVSYDARGNRKKLCLVMDEVDGMSAGDRGGVADLILTIKKSRVPIICICNDKYATKLKSLKGHCLELDYRKPTVPQISKRMLDICAKEGLAMNQATMDALVQSANGGDIRLILGQLQMIRLRARALTYDQVKTGGMSTAKDLEMSPFEAARRLLSYEGEGLSLGDQIDLVFQDMDLVPLLVQENYLNHRPKLADNELQRLRIMARAADGISAGDVATRAVRQYQNWSLAPFAAAMSTVYPATYMRGHREVLGLFPNEPNFPRFTAWLGQNSSAGKQRRLLGELHTRMLSSGGIECDRTGLRLTYLPVLRNTLTRPLLTQGKEGVPAVLRLMRDYCISREDIDFVTDVTKFKTAEAWGEDPMKKVETQVKSAFTREFNKQHIKPKTGFGMDDKVAKKRGKGKGKAAVEDEEDPFGEDGVGAEGDSPAKTQEEEEEEEELDPVMLQKKIKGMKHSGMTLTLKDGSTAPKASGRGRGGGRGGRGGVPKSGGRGSGAGRGRGKK